MSGGHAAASIPQVLLLARFSHPAKDLVAATLAWACRERGIEFDVYYAANRGGGLFSHHGSTLLGGRHHEVVARELARVPTTVVRLGEASVFGSLLHGAAARVIDIPDDEPLVASYERCLAALGVAVPEDVVAFQGADLPEGLGHGLAQYAFPEVIERKALAVPLELDGDELGRLVERGTRRVWTVATADADLAPWRRAGLAVEAAETLLPADGYAAFTFRVARRWLAGATGIDLCEPFLASSWLPFCAREDRLQVTGESMAEATAELAPLVTGLIAGGGDRVVYGRWGGGALGGARDDEDLYSLFAADLAFQVIEPVRPVLSVSARHPVPLPQPAASPFDLEPSDEQLRVWADKGRILATLVTHSGELSHDDAIVNTMDVCAATGVKAGIGVHAQRYAFSPHAVEPMQVPTEEGGVLGLCEPVLHSGGLGIVAESLATPDGVAAMMGEARGRIARLAGERFAPRGVYCYLDATPRDWAKRPERLWRAIAEAGFAYAISSVAQGNDNRLLYRDGDFVVLNQCGCSKYPYSPFMRVDRVSHLLEAERRLVGAPGPAWMIGVLDIPLYGYSAYLTLGDPSRGTRLGEFIEYLRGRGESGRLVSATPHTVARYARLLDDRGEGGATR